MALPALVHMVPFRHVQVIDLTGKRFGELKVLRRAGSSPTCGFAVWECQCSCGKNRSLQSIGTNLTIAV